MINVIFFVFLCMATVMSGITLASMKGKTYLDDVNLFFIILSVVLIAITTLIGVM